MVDNVHRMQNSLDLTDAPGTLTHLALPGGGLRYAASFYTQAQADHLFDTLLKTLHWQQDVLTMAGRQIPVPRLQAWYGVKDADYGYSGLALRPHPWHPVLAAIRDRIQSATGHAFNSVLANLYRDGRDSVDWHADNEAALGDAPVIASLSLGVQRRFQLRPRRAHSGQVTRLELAHGSLLLMEAGTQSHWQHRVPKEPGVQAARINLTFRRIVNATSGD